MYHSIYNNAETANNILSEIVKIGQNSRGAKTRKNSSGKDYYGFIRETKAQAVIVECAFVDNKKDIQILDTKAEQAAMGVAIAKGILKTLGISKLYRVQVGAYSVKANAEAMQKKLKAAGYDAIVVESR